MIIQTLEMWKSWFNKWTRELRLVSVHQPRSDMFRKEATTVVLLISSQSYARDLAWAKKKESWIVALFWLKVIFCAFHLEIKVPQIRDLFLQLKCFHLLTVNLLNLNPTSNLWRIINRMMRKTPKNPKIQMSWTSAEPPADQLRSLSHWCSNLC